MLKLLYPVYICRKGPKNGTIVYVVKNVQDPDIFKYCLQYVGYLELFKTCMEGTKVYFNKLERVFKNNRKWVYSFGLSLHENSDLQMYYMYR